MPVDQCPHLKARLEVKIRKDNASATACYYAISAHSSIDFFTLLRHTHTVTQTNCSDKELHPHSLKGDRLPSAISFAKEKYLCGHWSSIFALIGYVNKFNV